MARYGLAEKCVYTHLKMHLSLADKRQKSSSKNQAARDVLLRIELRVPNKRAYISNSFSSIIWE